MTPFFSVIIPLYNKEKSIEKTLKSVLAQRFQDFEIIIVNDGSTDNSIEEVAYIKDERIKLFSIDNQGVSFARNHGIDKASTNMIAFLDADDIWYPNHLEDLRNLIKQFPDCGLYATGFESVFYGKHTFKSKFLDLDDSFFGIVNDYFRHSLMNQIAWTSAVAIPKEILNKYAGFDVNLKTGEDTDLWTRIALQEHIAFDSKISAQKLMTDSQNHLSKSSYTVDKVNFLKKYNAQEKTNTSFKIYMDYNRFSVAIERKMVGDLENFKKIRKDIHSKNLNQKQNLLLAMPRFALNSLKQFQNFLLKHNVYLSAFR